MRELVYYVATSIDGFIAGPDGDASFFPNTPDSVTAIFQRLPETCPVHLREHFGITGDPVRFDAVLMGANTHQPALDAGLTSGYPHLQQYVVTTRDFPIDERVEFVRDNVAEFVRDLKTQDGKDIWLCGGGNLASQLIDEINELQVKINPILLGDGVPLLGGKFAASNWQKSNLELLPDDIVVITYRRSNS